MATPAVMAQAPHPTTTPMHQSFHSRSPSKVSDSNPYTSQTLQNSQNMSFSSQHSQSHHQYHPSLSQSMSSQNGAMAHPGYRNHPNESPYVGNMAQSYEKPQIYTVSCCTEDWTANLVRRLTAGSGGVFRCVCV